MNTMKTWILLACIALLALPTLAGAVVEEKSGVEYPDEITVGEAPDTVTLVATGVGLREKTFLKVDVYTIVSYVAKDTDLGDKPGEGLATADVPKRIQMDLRRGFSKEKLINSFVEGIEKNYDDISAFEADMNAFMAYFTRDAEEGDKLIFHYCPAKGLTTELNDETLGTIENKAFARALWTIWFGGKPVNGDLKKALLAQVK